MEALSKAEIDALKKEWLAEMKANMKVIAMCVCVCICVF